MLYVETAINEDNLIEDEGYKTPLTPSSKFTKSSLAGKQDLIDSILLCYWDNILGPRIQHVWYLTENSLLSNTTALFMCKKAMSGEICRDLSNSAIDYKYYTIPDQPLSILALIFSSANVFGLTLTTLLLTVNPRQRSQYLLKHELILRWMKRIVSKLKVYLSKDSMQNAVNIFSADLARFIGMMTSLHRHSLPHNIELRDTALSPSHPLDDEFLRKAITSHIVTMGRSVVVGKDVYDINMMISTLALLNNSSERACSCYVQHDGCYSYHQDVWLQGLLSGPENVLSTIAKEILCSHYPTTIIDMANLEIVQSIGCPDHFVWRHHTRVSELKALYTEEDEKHSFPKGMFTTFDCPETYIQTSLSDIKMLPANLILVESYLEHLKITLRRKAQALIKYLEMETDVSSTWSRVSLKKLKQDLDLTIEGNFRIVMATAEKIKPGIYSFLLGEHRDIPDLHQSYDNF